jgi:pantetheine-phosphate adenylyltransferase
VSARRKGSDAVVAVYPGTFDPVTNGHLDIIERGSRLFQRVVVAILENPEKDPMFTVRERKALIEAATRQLPNVEVDSFAGLLADYASSRGARVIVRGLRAISDFEYELQMALMNRRLDPKMETVFMMPNEAYSFLSSRLVKEVVALGGSVRGLVPPEVEKQIGRRARGRWNRPGLGAGEGVVPGAPSGDGSAVGAHGRPAGKRRRAASSRTSPSKKRKRK